MLDFIATIGAALSNNATGAVDNKSFRHPPKLIRRARRDQQLEDFRLMEIADTAVRPQSMNSEF